MANRAPNAPTAAVDSEPQNKPHHLFSVRTHTRPPPFLPSSLRPSAFGVGARQSLIARTAPRASLAGDCMTGGQSRLFRCPRRPTGCLPRGPSPPCRGPFRLWNEPATGRSGWQTGGHLARVWVWKAEYAARKGCPPAHNPPSSVSSPPGGGGDRERQAV